MAQTALDWLVEQLPLIQQEGLRDIIEQAKEMEKQQIKDAYEKGETNGIKSTNNANYTSLKTSEQYYNETFKK
jgi:hypothetical protein